MRKLLLVPFFCTVFTLVNAQSNSQFGTMPSVNLNKRLGKDWSANMKVETRQFMLSNKPYIEHKLTDISAIVAKRVTANVSVGVGYLMRIEGSDIENRTLQQISFVKRYSTFRMSHRFMFDQTFARNIDTELRLRYRLSAEIPLEGNSVDEKEFYLKLNNEYLNSLQKGDYDLEIRGAGYICYSISARNDIEFGIDYRTNSFLNGYQRQRIYLSINFFHSLGKL